MADVEQNRSVWEAGWDWSTAGDEWSSWWGGTPALWHGALLPRIHSFVPTGTILEIAPGYGRWTQYLKDLCDDLVIVDLTERCIEGCKVRFADATNIDYHVNDGRSLDMVADGSVDFVFSFDSLVHAEAEVLEAYAGQLARKLKPDGIGFFHHSNWGGLRSLGSLTKRLPERARRPLVTRGVLPDVYAWRAQSVTAELFAGQCDAAGLSVVAQEKINWEWGYYLMDALTVFTPRGSRWDRPRAVRRNPLFHAEAERMADLYSANGFPKGAGR
ncbi:MAG TPA: class I SAM-dependent methyltransferase [Thermoleophilaceae bacterium]|nr:class I SAM-dependent methyltransferase [Thermoleophilaceae bacterium]